VLAYHDRSDGGLLATLVEMAFAGRTGVEVDLAGLGADPVAALFTEELGAVVQVKTADTPRVLASFDGKGLASLCRPIGSVRVDDQVVVRAGARSLLSLPRTELRDAWSETTRRMQALRDDPDCAEEEHASRLDAADPGLNVRVPFDPSEIPNVATGARPTIAILREQGVNGQLEMAAAFDRAGFSAIDVHMSDLLEGRAVLADFRGLGACG